MRRDSSASAGDGREERVRRRSAIPRPDGAAVSTTGGPEAASRARRAAAGGATSHLFRTTTSGMARARDLREQRLLERPPAVRLGDEEGEVGPLEDLARLRDPQLAEGPFVVDARRVDEEDGPERKKLHRLLDRVGRRSGRRRDDRDVLSREGVQEARLADVPPAEEADVEPQAARGGRHPVSLRARSGVGRAEPADCLGRGEGVELRGGEEPLGDGRLAEAPARERGRVEEPLRAVVAERGQERRRGRGRGRRRAAGSAPRRRRGRRRRVREDPAGAGRGGRGSSEGSPPRAGGTGSARASRTPRRSRSPGRARRRRSRPARPPRGSRGSPSPA